MGKVITPMRPRWMLYVSWCSWVVGISWDNEGYFVMVHFGPISITRFSAIN